MASYDVLDHEISSLQHLLPQTLHPIPLHFIRIVLTIEVSHYTPTTAVPFFNQRTVSFPFVLLQNHALFEDFLYTTLQSLRINTDSPDCGRIVQEIMQRGLDIVRAYAFRFQGLYLQSVILVGRRINQQTSMTRASPVGRRINQQTLMTRASPVGRRINQQTSMTRALDMSRSDFESNNYGMVAATPSSVKDMIKRITVEDGVKQNCVVCLEELEVGLEASRMPCSHIFHGDCIETWLKQAHSCPICRYKMPTMTDYTDK